jgi:hypothetical protein
MPTEDVLKFVRPDWKQGLQLGFWALVMFLASAWVAPDTLASKEGIIALTGFCIYVLLLVVVVGIQRVTIDADVVHILNPATCFRWRTVRLGEIESVTYTAGGHKSMVHCLVVRLQPARHRSWDSIRLGAVMTSGIDHGIDTPLFVEFMRALSRLQPGMEVHGLPAGYRGVLPAVRCEAGTGL